MLPPIVCWECGTPIGDKADLFLAERKELVEAKLAELNITADHALTAVDLQIDCGEILDRLLLPRICCRKVLLTVMLFEAQ